MSDSSVIAAEGTGRNPSGRLKGKVAVITGGATGLGRAYADVFSAEGAAVIIADVNADAGAIAGKEISNQGRRVAFVQADISDPAAVAEIGKTAKSEFGGLDILVNNAAIFQRPAITYAPLPEIPLEEWQRVLSVNVMGTVLCCSMAIPLMRERGGGHIVNVASATFFRGTPSMSHYVASKGAVIGITRSLSKEVGQYNISVNTIAPGLVQSVEEVSEFQEVRHRGAISARSLQHRALPSDIVGTVLFLCSDDSAFMTGQTLVIDGGTVLN